MTDSNSNFVRLPVEELTPKLTTLAAQKEMLKIWKKGHDSTIYRTKDFNTIKSPSRKEYLLTLFSEGEDNDKDFADSEVYFTFTLNESDYFGEGEVTIDESDENLVIRVIGEFYRSEKRSNERLLTFPHHQVYAYFKVLNEKEESNVIKLEREEDRLYIDYKQKQKQALKEKLKKKITDVEDLVGFRALDISRSGIAFMVGKEESKYFNNKNKYSFYVLFDGSIFVIKGGDLVYKVDYLSGSSKKHFKVGLTFKPVEKLSKHIKELLESQSKVGSLQKEFEDFVNE